MRTDAKIERLKGISLFAGAKRRELDRISQLCTELTLPAGRVLCHEGEIGHEFFVLESGTVSVSVGGKEVATLGAGSFFGELALLDGGPRTATVRAQTEVTALVLDRREFHALLEEDPIVAVRLLPAIGARLRRQRESTPQRESSQEHPPLV
jgi:CRP/FNR family transcriptional regulator, cyclic AMP receptor protein